MSQAFIKEGDQSDDLPERPVSPLPNYVTPSGYQELKDRREQLVRKHDALRGKKDPSSEAAFKAVLRDLRYFEIRIGTAVVIDNTKKPPPDVRFGATLELKTESGTQTLTIVGEDEADAAKGKISWASPLATALIGTKPGDAVSLPEGQTATLLRLSYL